MNDAKPQFEEELFRLRDELHLKAHLASMEVREAWEALQPRLHELERSLKGSRGAASRALREMAENLRERLMDLREAMRRDAEAGLS